MNEDTVPNPPAAKGPRMQVDPPVFFTSAGPTLAFAGLGALFPAQAKSIFDVPQAAIVRAFGWFSVAGFLGFALFLMLSRTTSPATAGTG